MRISLLVLVVSLQATFAFSVKGDIIRSDPGSKDCYGNCCYKLKNGDIVYVCELSKRTCTIECYCECQWTDEFNQVHTIITTLGTGRQLVENCKIKKIMLGNPSCNGIEMFWSQSDCLIVFGEVCFQQFSVWDNCPSYEYPLFNCEIKSR